jgi:dsDNA-specific endonuclease/ATPase MutS2
MEMKKILSLGERLQRLLEKTEQEAQAIISEAQKGADEIIKKDREDAEKKRLSAQRRTGLEAFLKEAEIDARKEAEKVKEDYSTRAESIRSISQEKIDDAASYLAEEVLRFE